MGKTFIAEQMELPLKNPTLKKLERAVAQLEKENRHTIEQLKQRGFKYHGTCHGPTTATTRRMFKMFRPGTRIEFVHWIGTADIYLKGPKDPETPF